MKLRFLALLMPLMLLLSGCPDKPLPSNNSRQLGENCDEINACDSGMYCEYGICRLVCADTADCEVGQECKEGRCVKSTNVKPNDPGDNTDIPGPGDNTDIPGPGDNTDIPGPGDNTDVPPDSNSDAQSDVPPGPQDNHASSVTGTPVSVGGKVSSNSFEVEVTGGAIVQKAESNSYVVTTKDGH